MMRNPQRFAILRASMVMRLFAILGIALAACDTDSLLEGEPTPGGGGGGPTVTLQADLPERASRTDSLYATVTAQAKPPVSGLTRVGIAVRQGATTIVRGTDVGGQAAATRTLSFSAGDLTPDAQGNIAFQLYGWAIDAAGQCTLVGANGLAVSCGTQAGEPVIAGLQGVAASLQVIAARMQKIASSSALIGDIVVDAARRRLYVSNKSTSSVDVVTWSGPALVRSNVVPVGALPFGMTLDRTGDTLIVANSGGTSLSYVDVAGLREAHRYETPNAVLYQITPEGEGTAVLEHIDFSDRPQFVAQDREGFVLYSTQPTPAAPNGSIRWVEKDAGWSQREANLMLWTQVIDGNAWGPGVNPQECWVLINNIFVNNNNPGCVIAFVDSVKIFYESPMLGTQLAVYDHRPGTSTLIADTSGNWHELKTRMQQLGSDIFMYLGQWQMDEWLTGDTTYVASSGNGASISISEGARDPGRTWIWNAMTAHPPDINRLISDVVNIADYANNTSDRITGLSLNNDGLLLATRSESSAFFFTNPLRLYGMFTDTAIAGGRGVALHPAALLTGGDPRTDWAAVGGSEAEIIIVDTRHFRRIGTIPIGEPSAGPLRVIGRVDGDPTDVVAHIFGVTETGAVFEVAVRNGDINP